MTSSPKSHWEWLEETEALFTRLEAEPGWTQMRSTKTDHQTKYLFSRAVTENGPIIHFALFLHEKDGKLRGLCQFGEDANSFMKGSVHGGAIATMHDTTTGVLAMNMGTKKMYTGYLNTTFLRPIRVRSTVLMEAVIDKVDGNKTFLKGYLKSPDEKTVYSECTALYVNADKAAGSNM
ncbi:acyl-coenzyme A thioesterase THEM4-like [Acanthaster planci]|uniref:Acyl-coenzyme A thioesterase THEM4 n=1 Tax=Acanthaster planci TaxID=133434 RepID=A0A8B8A0B2_ACAPL|nr:acyl-coenzyme A thioesterase THEM4-like [Acanthaster planci]XP_022111197.1 acyl-coenzyme A thioesterase THEM4-like [Acanthaster planci]XP_022111198.1 acyl-coenzyme A thioesterase THEM4-like [Acanthaster planci]XP_022111200.1 acyl-coenzyme A thioesterase THEM4-like [Acanthaster planci]